MKWERIFVAICAVLMSSPIVLAADKPEPKPDGLSATITDTAGFKMKLDALVFKFKLSSGLRAKAIAHDHIPMTSDRKPIKLWLAQIATAEFTPKAGGKAGVKAALQGEGEGDSVSGVAHNTRRGFFEGKIAEGARKGRVVRFPFAEVKSLTIHTKYTGGARDLASPIIPMPKPDQDVFWVSSVPLGAIVYAKSFGGAAERTWKEYVKIGKTPFRCELTPGTYAVKVLVPEKLALKLRPATKLGDDANPFECDGWGEKDFRKGENIIASFTYTVVKREGKAATLIALFQRKGLTLDEAIEGFPEGYGFNFSDKKLTGQLLFHKVPRADIPRILDALHRGGKIIWHGKTRSRLIELTNGPRGWRIGNAARPRKRRGGK